MHSTAKILLLLSLAGAALAGCADLPMRADLAARASVTVEDPEPWREAAAEADAALVDGTGAIWSRLLATRRQSGRGGGDALLDPNAALPRAAPAPGVYLCRFRALGAPPPRVAAPGFCYVGVNGDRLSLTVEAGPERLGGYLWESRTSGRLVFLGAAAARRGGVLRGYGEDPAAGVAGLFERIGDFRYRLAIPSRDGARLGLYELTPAPLQSRAPPPAADRRAG